MKHKFVNATIADRKKGRETVAPHTQPHPLRETVYSSEAPSVHMLPKPKMVAEDPMDKVRAEVAKMLADKPKAKKALPRSRILGMNLLPEPELTHNVNDILALLAATKK